VAYATFVAAFLVEITSERPPRARAALLGMETVAALSCLALGTAGLTGALLAVIAGQAPFTLGARARAVGPWIALQSGALLAIWLVRWGALDAVAGGGAYVGFQLFALGAATLTRRESAARLELSRAHAELVATQSLLGETARGAERLRIARELHDTVGHHLTALGLNLEVAKNATGSDAQAAVERARAIAKELLSEVRDAVGSFRADRPIDLDRALRMLVAGVPRPRVRLSVAPIAVRDAVVAHALFRCVQEALTNALRHADAASVTIDVREEGGDVRVRVHDDGRGVAAVRPGNGLAGLRERVEALGGTLRIESSPGRGLTLSALIPSGEGAHERVGEATR
jgi:signal transduction histidine kinase